MSVLLALTANCHRHSKKSRALKPSDYDVFRREPDEVIEVDRDNIGLMRTAFIGVKEGNATS